MNIYESGVRGLRLSCLPDIYTPVIWTKHFAFFNLFPYVLNITVPFSSNYFIEMKPCKVRCMM